MSSKLDQSLDEIAGAQRRNDRRRTGRGSATSARGVVKSTTAKPTKAPKATAHAAPDPRGDSKVIVSNLPDDVTEQQIKEYFSTTVGPVKRVIMSYNKIGRSTGQVTIIFAHTTSAAKAAKTYDGVKVDGRPMKIEVVLTAASVDSVPGMKSLKDRIAPPKISAERQKQADSRKAGPGSGKRGGKAGRPVRRPKKTAEELDADMADYFDPSAAATSTAAGGANGASTAAAVTAPENAMQEDDIL